MTFLRISLEGGFLADQLEAIRKTHFFFAITSNKLTC